MNVGGEIMRISIEKQHMTPEQIALFRYSVIAPIVTRGINSDHSKEWYFRDAAEKTYSDEHGNNYRISASTIKRWYLAFRLGGLEALSPSARKDKGGTRRISKEASEFIIQMLNSHPNVTATTIYEQMIRKSIIDSSDVSLSTVCRFVLNQRKVFHSKTKDVEMKRYEMENVNDVWCGDTTHGPKVLYNGEFKKVYVIAFIDDKSRYIVSIGATISDNTLALAEVMKDAVRRHGVPKKFNFDNGSNYRSDAIKTIVARLNSEIHYNRPYTPTGKAKIERWFGTLKKQWMPSLPKNITYEKFCELLVEYVRAYNTRPHSSLDGKSPWEVYFEKPNQSKLLDKIELDNAFLIKIQRKASIDCVVNIGKREYEVPSQFSGIYVTLEVSPDLSMIYVTDHVGKRMPVKLLDKTANSKIERKKLMF